MSQRISAAALSARSIAAGLLLVAATVSAKDRMLGEIETVVDRSGKVESCKLLESSGDPALDRKAIADYRGQTFPVPAGYAPEQQHFTLLLPVRPIKDRS
jgi:TonB family protein